MANIYKQADQRRRVTPGSKKTDPTVVKEEPTVTTEGVVEKKAEEAVELVVESREEVVEVKDEPIVEKTVEKEKPAAPAKKPKKELEKTAVAFDFPVRSKSKKKNYSLYLSEDNMAELQKRSKQYGMSISEYLDEILKKVFEG